MKRFFGWMILIGASLVGQETDSFHSDEAMNVTSGEVHYNGKEIILDGEVVVQHGLGQISAHHLSVIPSSSDDKKQRSAFLTISDDVQIELQGGGRLNCQRAEVDYTTLQGIFLGNAQFPDVCYANTGESPSLSLEVRSGQMILDLVRESAEPANSPKTFVRQVQANQKVRVNVDRNYFLTADRALYQRLPSEESSSVAGLLILSMNDDSHVPCQLTSLQGDRMTAESIEVDLINRTLRLAKSSGQINFEREKLEHEKNPKQKIEFAAENIVWNDRDQILHMSGNVSLMQNEKIKLETDHELHISQTVANGKRTIRAIDSPRDTVLTYEDLKQGREHSIRCPGPLTIDHEKQEIILQGLLEGPEGEFKQVSIEDALGEMHADKITITYDWERRNFYPNNIILEGDVRLLNQSTGGKKLSGAMRHYALADRVDYFPKKQEMILKCTEGSRVLLLDKVNNVQMSAPSLTILRDVATGKETIRGLGNVRFSFVEKEIEQLNQFFRLQKSDQKESKNAK